MSVSFFRFYEELNDFLPVTRRKKTLEYIFRGSPAVKDPIEAQGVPHTEVDLIIVGGDSVAFNYRLQPGDRVAVYPVFETFDIAPLIRLRDHPLRRTTFVLDVHLGKLARKLRMLGFDTSYRNSSEDADLVRLSVDEGRVLLTRDRRLLFHKAITHGYWIRSTQPEEQVMEVLRRFDLYGAVRPFQRCLDCNGSIEWVDKQEIIRQLQPLTRRYYHQFYRCDSCRKVYWRGSHMEHMSQQLGSLVRGRV